MKKSLFHLSFLAVIIITGCSKNVADNNNITRTVTIKPSKVTNGYFSIIAPAGFTVSVDNYDPYPNLAALGSSGNIFKNGNFTDSIHFNFGKQYMLHAPQYIDLSNLKYYYQKDSILNIDREPINNFTDVALVTFFNHKDTTDKRLELFAFSINNNPNAKLQIYSKYGLNSTLLAQVKSMMKSAKYYAP